MSESYMNIKFSDVIDLIPERQTILLRNPKAELFCSGRILMKKDFDLFKFNIVKWLRKQKNPNDRILRYETEENGVWSLDKEEKLIKSRMTRKEQESGLIYL